jgi:hypothetical protein
MGSYDWFDEEFFFHNLEWYFIVNNCKCEFEDTIAAKSGGILEMLVDDVKREVQGFPIILLAMLWKQNIHNFSGAI